MVFHGLAVQDKVRKFLVIVHGRVVTAFLSDSIE